MPMIFDNPKRRQTLSIHVDIMLPQVSCLYYQYRTGYNIILFVLVLVFTCLGYNGDVFTYVLHCIFNSVVCCSISLDKHFVLNSKTANTVDSGNLATSINNTRMFE